MKTKRILIGIIGAVFVLITIFAVFSIFTVRNVQIVFTTFEGDYYAEVDLKTQALNGKNLVFVKEDEIKKEIEKNPYLVAEVEKSIPGTVIVSITERREVYILENEGKTLVLSDEGYVLGEKDLSAGVDPREYIEISIDGINVITCAFGEKIRTDDDRSFYLALSLSNEAKLTDCIDTMAVKKNAAQVDLSFKTYTSVEIDVPKFNEYGSEKVAAAFEAYTSLENDYIKTFNKINVSLVDNEVVVVWEKNPLQKQ